MEVSRPTGSEMVPESSRLESSLGVDRLSSPGLFLDGSLDDIVTWALDIQEILFLVVV